MNKAPTNTIEKTTKNATSNVRASTKNQGAGPRDSILLTATVATNANGNKTAVAMKLMSAALKIRISERS